MPSFYFIFGWWNLQPSLTKHARLNDSLYLLLSITYGWIRLFTGGASSLLLSRFRRSKPSNASWVGRSMEHLAVAGSSSPLPATAASTLPGPSSSTMPNIPSTSTPSKGRNRLATEPCSATDGSNEDIPKCMQPFLLFPFLLTISFYLIKLRFAATVATPKSPRTPTVGGPAVMIHSISHRFTMTFKMLTVCDLCLKQMFIGKFHMRNVICVCRIKSLSLFYYAGLKCKECKYKCHRDCEARVPPSCKLPPEYIDFFRQCINDGICFLCRKQSRVWLNLMFCAVRRSSDTNNAASRWY